MKKIFIISACTLLFIAGFFFFLIPSFLSSQAGKNFLVRQISKRADAKVEIQTVSFSWLKGQKISGFQLEKKGELLLNFESLNLETSFWTLMRQSGTIKKATLVKPQISLHSKAIMLRKIPGTQSTGVSSKPKKKTKPIWSNFSGKIKIEEGTLSLKQGGVNLIHLESVDFDLDFPKNGRMYTLQTKGTTMYDQFRGDFTVQGNVTPKKEVINLETTKILDIDGKARFNQFPVGAVDALCALFAPELKGLFMEGLGDRLNLEMNVSNNDLSLALKSPRMTLSFQSDYEKGLIHLKNPMRMTWNMRPMLIQTFIKKLPIVSRGDTYLELELSTLSLLYKNMHFDFSTLAASGNLSLSRGAYSLSKSSQSLLVDNVSLAFNTSKLNESLNVSTTTSFRYGAFPETKIQGKLTAVNLSTFPVFDLTIRNFPTQLAEELLENENSIQNRIGSNFDLTMQRFNEGGKSQLFVSASSPLFNLSSSRLVIGEELKLISPTSFTYRVTPKLFDQIEQPVTIDGILATLEIPKHSWKKTTLQMSLKGHDFMLKDLAGFGQLQLPFFSCKLEGALDQLITEVTTQIDFAQNTWGHSLMGSPVATNISGNIDITREFAISPLRIKLDGKKLKTTIDGAFEKQAFVIKKPLEVDLVLDPNQVNPILIKEGNIPLLAKSTSMKLEVSPGTFPLGSDMLSDLDIKIEGKIPNLQMITSDSRHPFTFENVSAELELSKKKPSQFSIKANTVEEGVIELSLVGDDLQTPSQVEVSFQSLSSVVADALLQMRGTLAPIVGQTIDLEFMARKKSQSQDLDIMIKSSNLSLEGTFTVTDRLKLRNNSRPLKIRWSMDEDGYQALGRLRNNHTGNSPFEIKNQAIVRLDISPLNLPVKSESGIFPKVDFNLYQADFNADMRISSLILAQTQIDAVSELEKFDLTLRKRPENGPLTFRADGVVVSRGSKGKSGQIKSEGTLENFLSKEGKIDLHEVTAKIDAHLSHLPSILFDVILKTYDASALPPSEILGDSVNAAVNVDIKEDSGAVKIDLNASACRAKLNGIVGGGILYLDDPLQAVLTITPGMNQRLAKSAKVVITSMKSPVTLLVHPDGFSVPLRNLGLDATNVKYGVIDFGQLTCSNAGNTSDVSSIFRMEDRQNNISIWFAPMEFNIKEGLMYVDRTEILYNRSYQAALWGDIDFNRRNVDMILGLTAQSLKAAIGIIDVPANYVLKVPVKGPFGNVKVDKGAATSKIALLLGRRLAPQTGVWGNVLGAIGRIADDQSDVPPPKPPFPWQNVINMQERLTPRSSLEKLKERKAQEIYGDLKKLLKPTQSGSNKNH